MKSYDTPDTGKKPGKNSQMNEILRDAREAFSRCQDANDHNRIAALEDIRFAKLSEQWPSEVEAQRNREKRPCLTINKLPAFIRQVVNDSRLNKPSIKVHPVDSGADPETAEIINGLIRNIEYTSNADVAYDTAIESAVTGGFGYFRIGMDYAYDDSFDMDLTIQRISNPFSVYGDPNSTAADSSDWDEAFVVDAVPKRIFKRRYKGVKNANGSPVAVDFSAAGWNGVDDPWLGEDSVLVAEYWTRREITREIVLLDDGRIFDAKTLEEDPDLAAVNIALESGMAKIADRRVTKSHEVRQRILTGADVLEDNLWPGRYIPIVPVYGDEFDVEGKRYFRSLVYNAKDAQRMVNYWRTTSTELVALAPRVPWIGKKGTFKSDAQRWSTANTQSHAFLEFDTEMPLRQPLDSGIAAGALQEALNAADDMKSIIGLYDASLGARSNETSGRAIMARQREGDVATFHFIDNLSRAIRHAGRILIDLIPRVYDAPRIVRVLGEDGSQFPAAINQEVPMLDPQTGEPLTDETGNAITAMHDLSAGKYDLTVTAGPSFTSRREEAAMQMTEFIRAFPEAAPIIGGLLARNLDWPGAAEIADRLDAINPLNEMMGQGQPGLPPEIEMLIEQGQQFIAELEAENAALKQDRALQAQKAQTDAQIRGFEAQTRRMKAEGDLRLDAVDAGVNIVDRLSGERP